jgi:hypothetical protein
MNDAQAAELRRRRREFIRSQHPDRGGDTGAFVAGLRAFAEPRAAAEPEDDPGPLPTVIVVRRTGWFRRGSTALARRFRAGAVPPRVR